MNINIKKFVPVLVTMALILLVLAVTLLSGKGAQTRGHFTQNIQQSAYQVQTVRAHKQFHIHYVACPEAVQSGISKEWDQKTTHLRPLIQQWYLLGLHRKIFQHWFSDATMYDRHQHVLGHIHQKCT